MCFLKILHKDSTDSDRTVREVYETYLVVKKTTRHIRGALAVGILLVLGAFYVRGHLPEEHTALDAVVVVPAPTRTYIETKDSNGDGVKDWEESFIQNNITLSSTTDEGPYTTPNTLTGKFSEAFLKDYLEGKIKGNTITDKNALVGSAIAAVEKNTQSTIHTTAELTVVPTTKESLRTYGNTLATIIQKRSIKNENEMVILKRALATENQQELKKLIPIQEVYTQILDDSRTISVPSELARSHVALLNACEALILDIRTMQVAFTDPLYALARYSHYKEDALSLFNALQGIHTTLDTEGVMYSKDEAGSYFNSFTS